MDGTPLSNTSTGNGTVDAGAVADIAAGFAALQGIPVLITAPRVNGAAVAGRKHPRSEGDVLNGSSPENEPTPSPSLVLDGANAMGGEDEEGNDGGAVEEELEDEDADASGEKRAGALPSGRRMRLTLGQKREVVDLAASKKFTHKELAEKFRVGRTTITNICRQEDLIRTETDSADATKKKRKTTKCTYDLRVLDECLHKWRMEVKVSSPDTKLTGTVLQQKAMDIAMKILHEPYADLPDKVRQALAKFSASNGWLDGYRTRFGSFSSKQFNGDSSVIKNVDIQTRLREIHHSLSGVDVQDVWTGSEFAVTFKPNMPTMNHPGQLHDAGNSNAANNGRYTVALFVSAAGEKFDMQVIGMDRSPVLLEGVNTEELYKIHYGHSKTGWQVAHTMVTMLKALNQHAKNRKRTFRVILDSAVPHVKAAMILDSQGDQRTFFIYDHLHIYFLPPNFKPPRFHPCHLGIIQAFKARFRYEMLETLFTNYRQSVMTQDMRGFHPSRHLHSRNVFHWFYVALHSLDQHLIQNCWVQSGLLPTQVIANLNMKDILRSSGSVNGQQPPALTTGNSTSQLGTIVSNVVPLYRDLQSLMAQINQMAPDFLHWVGANDPMNAQAYVEMEGNACVTDPGVDEVQIIRSVLQKHGFLSTKRLDDAAHATGQFESMADVADELCPRPEDVLTSIGILKRYLRLTHDVIPDRVEAVVQLNRVKANLGNAAVVHQSADTVTHQL